MGPGWQAIDMAVRALKVALQSQDLQKSMAVVAALSEMRDNLSQIVSAYTTGTAGASKSPKPEKAPSEISQGEPPSSDADAAPSQGLDSELT